ncbi:aldo/keto reductase [Asanoa sp. WMMD1127]|uniref:aldo/keto reductase n=1 Tax=Asanoa sp. WMMD1127 TaxID=3016107 RepID=UPI00241778C6|nr:aldo/keto reductase [Asanoa sp. WMMD1127]MDG4820661.1 aldo/keto reductase [Asanoa sp. WMMD1127]
MTSSTAQPTVKLPGDVRMPLLGFGTWQAHGESAYRAVGAALDSGYRLIDTATAYGNEDLVGRAVAESSVPREDIFITTKLPPDRVGREQRTMDESLQLLGVDQLDLWLIHWPPHRGGLVDNWRRMIEIRDAGQTRSIGVSNYSLAQIDELIAETGLAPAVNQIKWGPRLYDKAEVQGHHERGVVLEGYSPFKTTRLGDPVLTRIAEAHGVSAAQVVVRWHIQHGIVVIPKSVTPSRIRDNGDVFGFELSAEEMSAIDGMGK